MRCYNGGMNIMALLHTFFSTLFGGLGISAEFFGFLVIAIGFMFIWILLPKVNDPELEKKLKSIDDRLIYEPENARLLLAKAEILLRFRTPFSSLALLEHAYDLGIPLEEIEPTYCKCFREISYVTGKYGTPVYPNYWETATSEAPTLTLKLAVDRTEGERMCEKRKKREALDTAARQKIIDSIDTLLLTSGDTAAGAIEAQSGDG